MMKADVFIIMAKRILFHSSVMNARNTMHAISVKSKSISNKDNIGRLRVAAALGVTVDAVERAEALVHAGVDAMVIDTAHGHTRGVVSVLKKVKEHFP